MSTPLVIIVTAIYSAVALSQFISDRPGFGVMFAGYAFANLGIIWQMHR